MNRLRSIKEVIDTPPDFPNRRGKRPITILGPLHVQCGGHGDEQTLRDLVDEVITWPYVEADPLPDGRKDVVSLQINEEVATGDPSAFISGREFGRVLFGSPTIYLTLPMSCAHRAVVRGWAEPHFSSSFGLVPLGAMVVYTPRDEHEVAVCRSLFWMSYNFSISEKRERSTRWNGPRFDLRNNGEVEESVAKVA
jgi:hypothetical protein